MLPSPGHRAGLSILLAALLLAAPGHATGPAGDEALLRARRLEMVRGIEQAGGRDSTTLAALRAVPRHEFVRSECGAQAYGDYPLPIESGDQDLLLVERDGRGVIRTRNLLPVRFVPLLRGPR